jgi:hypothetical protein
MPTLALTAFSRPHGSNAHEHEAAAQLTLGYRRGGAEDSQGQYQETSSYSLRLLNLSRSHNRILKANLALAV